MNQTSRRALLAIIAAAPIVFAATPGSATSLTTGDAQWATLVSDYHAKHSAWLDICGYEDDLVPQLQEACAMLPPEPQKPASSLPNISQMTIAQIRDAVRNPASETAWSEYERDHAAWKEQRKAFA